MFHVRVAFALAAAGYVSALPASSATSIFTIFSGAGNEVSNIVTYQFDAGAKTLKVAGQSTTGLNPSWLEVRKNVLYTTNEIAEGKIQSFSINSNGSLSAVSTVSSGGNGPTHLLPLSTGQVVAMNFGGGTVGLIPTSGSNASSLSATPSVIKFAGDPSNPHQAVERNGEIFIPDLGADKIWRLKLSDNKLSLTGNIPQPEGSGPRHMEILDKQLFVLHENDNTLTVQPLPASPTGKSSITSTVSIVPPGVPAKSTFAAAELLIPANSTAFPTSFIYASNRNIGPDFDPRGDAVAILQNTNGKLSVVGHAFTGLTNIRSMRFGGPDKRYLIVGSATAGGVAVFERTSGGKNLTLVARDATIPIRTSFAWLE